MAMRYTDEGYPDTVTIAKHPFSFCPMWELNFQR